MICSPDSYYAFSTRHIGSAKRWQLSPKRLIWTKKNNGLDNNGLGFVSVYSLLTYILFFQAPYAAVAKATRHHRMNMLQ